MSTDASDFDQYKRIQIQGVSSADGTTPTNIEVDPTTNAMLVSASIDTTGLATTTTDTNTTTIAGDTTSIDAKIPALGQALAAGSVPVVLPAAQITTLTPPAAITGFATAANQLPDGHNVTIDNSTGAAAVNIQDGGNTITVDGTVTANLSATDNTVLDNIDADLTTIIGHVDGIETLIGTTNTNTGATTTALQIMDDWDNAASDGASVSGDVAHDTADAGEPVKIGMRAFSPDGTTPGTAVAENDRTNAKGDLDGRLFTNDEHPRWWSYHVNGSSALTDATVQASPGAGFQIVITNICFSSGAATAINMFLEESTTTIFGPIYLEAVAGRGFCTPAGFKKHITAATAVTITTSASIAHSVDIQGYIQAV